MSGNEADSGKDFLLIRDSFFSNLIIGFKFNKENVNIKSIEEIKSDSILVWNIIRMYHDEAIYGKKGIISDTGIVETTIDMNESWKTTEEVREIGKSYIKKNGLKFDGEIQLILDTSCDIKIGDTIKIDKMLYDGIYIVTNIQEEYQNASKQYNVSCKNGNLLTNFIDIFRGENPQENEEKTYQVITTHYIEEQINEIYEVIK